MDFVTLNNAIVLSVILLEREFKKEAYTDLYEAKILLEESLKIIKKHQEFCKKIEGCKFIMYEKSVFITPMEYVKTLAEAKKIALTKEFPCAVYRVKNGVLNTQLNMRLNTLDFILNPNKEESMAKVTKNVKEKKFAKVMDEFSKGDLKTSAGKKVKKIAQAKAIAVSESKKGKKK